MDLLNILISLVIGIFFGWLIAYFYYESQLSKKCGESINALDKKNLNYRI